MSSPEVAVKADVDKKTVNNMLNARYDPRPEMVQKVGAVFGLTEWQLLMPNLPADMLKNHHLHQVIEHYVAASPSGRESICRVAEMAARYHVEKEGDSDE